VLHYSRLDSFAKGKDGSLMVPFVTYNEIEMWLIQSQVTKITDQRYLIILSYTVNQNNKKVFNNPIWMRINYYNKHTIDVLSFKGANSTFKVHLQLTIIARIITLNTFKP
jgi:hypothetical protein